MKITLSEQRTHEGFTYLAGEHEVSESVGAALLANFPAVCSVASDTHAPKMEKLTGEVDGNKFSVSGPETEFRKFTQADEVEIQPHRKRKKTE